MNAPIDAKTLDAIPVTLLITVWARALATREGIIGDPFAVELLEEQPELFAPLESGSPFFKRLMTVGVGVRTRCFEREVRRFLADHPEGLVLNVGCGLDARAHRLDNGRATWVDVDVDDAVSVRRRLLPDAERRHILSGSLLSPSAWLGAVPRRQGQPVLLTVEGTLMYFEHEDVRRFMSAVVEHFGELAGFVELTGDMVKDKVHPSVKAVGSDAPFRSGYRRPAEALAGMHTAIDVRSHESLFHHERNRWGIFRILTALFPSLHDRFGSVLIAFTTIRR